MRFIGLFDYVTHSMFAGSNVYNQSLKFAAIDGSFRLSHLSKLPYPRPLANSEIIKISLSNEITNSSRYIR